MEVELLLRTLAVIAVAYAFCKLVQLIFVLIQQLYYLVLYGTLYLLYKVGSIFNFNGVARHSAPTSASPLRIRSGPVICNFQPESAIHFVEKVNDNSTITIAVDATPKGGGGLLILPKRKEIHFYSIKWPSHFRNEPDKFEMLNAYLALLIFEGTVASYRKRFNSSSDALLLKCDNNFCTGTAYNRQKNSKWRELFLKVDSKLISDPFLGEWKYEKCDDLCILMADKLSRTDCSELETLPTIRIPDSNNYPNLTTSFLPDFSRNNVSLERNTKMGIYNIAFQAQKLEFWGMFDIFSMQES